MCTAMPNQAALPTKARPGPNQQQKRGKKTGRNTEDNSETCPECQLKYKDGEQWIQCDKCERWYHRSCAEIMEDEEWEQLQKEESTFHCHLC